MGLKISTRKVIELQDWDRFIEETYGRPYSFQQQDNCKDRGIAYLEVPSDGCYYENDTIPYEINGEVMGVSLKAWLERDYNEAVGEYKNDFHRRLWWERNFYPSVDEILDDLYKKGLIEEGEYIIVIDW